MLERSLGSMVNLIHVTRDQQVIVGLPFFKVERVHNFRDASIDENKLLSSAQSCTSYEEIVFLVGFKGEFRNTGRFRSIGIFAAIFAIVSSPSRAIVLRVQKKRSRSS
ncbi:unnamed protein product [Microthlaspi erraticum]|uniref:Uncharacterized protein n=1 Tax=Microthlaspi erraticum TaxID=1685480 RepID=A0A6D2HN62_9BRAS|nr:unnamed protein product [Microthlaspi erraticum]